MNEVITDNEGVPVINPSEKTRPHDEDHKSISVDSLKKNEGIDDAESNVPHHSSSLTITDSDYFEESGREFINSNDRNSSYLSSSNNLMSYQGSGSAVRRPSRRTSQLSDITFESDDLDAFTSDSNDDSFSWKDSYSALISTASRMGGGRFASSETPGDGNSGTLVEEGQEGETRISGSSPRSSAANTDAPVIPRRRVSVTYTGVKSTENTTHESNDGRHFSMRGNSAAPTLPQRSSSHTSKMDSSQNKCGSVAANSDSPSRAIPSSNPNGEEIDATTRSNTSPTTASSPPRKNEKNQELHDHRRSRLRESRAHSIATSRSEDPPVLPERRASHCVPSAFASGNGFAKTRPALLVSRRLNGDETNESDANRSDEMECTPSAATKSHSTSKQPPSIPLRKHSDSPYPSSDLLRPLKPSIQAPTQPIRKESSHRTITNSFSNTSVQPPMIPLRQASESIPLESESSFAYSPPASVVADVSNQPPTIPMRQDSGSSKSVAKNGSLLSHTSIS